MSKIQDWLTAEHSKHQAETIAKWAAEDENVLAELMQILFGNDDRLAQRAAWPIHFLVKISPQILEKWLPEMVVQLRLKKNDAVKRAIVRAMEEMEIPENLHGEVADICFGLVADPEIAVAIRVFSMTVLEKIVWEHPELREELRLILEANFENEKPAFRSRARKILAKMNHEFFTTKTHKKT